MCRSSHQVLTKMAVRIPEVRRCLPVPFFFLLTGKVEFLQTVTFKFVFHKLVIAIAKWQQAKILPIHARCWIYLEVSWNTVIDEKYELNSIVSKIVQTLSKGHTYTNPRPGQSLTRPHSRITRAVTATDATDNCFTAYWSPSAWQSRG